MRSDFGIVRFIIFFAVIAALIFFGVLLFSGGDDSDTETRERGIDLQSYLDRNITVRMTQGGRIVGNDEYREVRVSVNRNERRLELIRGYQSEVYQTQSFNNNGSAFEAFLLALNSQGFGNEREAADALDERGACPRGRRFVFEVFEGEQLISRQWAVSCSSREGTLAGNRSGIQRLFEDQITDYRQLVRSTRL